MHAFMIIAHNQFELLEKLISALDDPRNDIFVHIDAKVKNFDFDYFNGITKYSRLVFTKERLSIAWGDYSIVRCETLLLKTAIENENPQSPYEYYHLLSGVDLPIKSNDCIHRFFSENSGSEFVHYSSNTVEQGAVNRVRYYHILRGRRNLFNKIIAQAFLIVQKLLGVNRLKNTDIKVQKGCQWFSITGDLAKYVVKKSAEYERLFAHSYCCDEIFLQTIVESSDFKNRLYMPNCNNNHEACMRLIDWQRGNPYVWRIGDYEEITRSSCMFARKFDFNADPEIVEKILNNR